MKINLNNVSLEEFHSRKVKLSTGAEAILRLYNVIYRLFGKIPAKIGKIETLQTIPRGKSKGLRYICRIDISSLFRGKGIGSTILRKYFSGSYLVADNPRAAKLYERLAEKQLNKFTQRESDELYKLIIAVDTYGAFKLR